MGENKEVPNARFHCRAAPVSRHLQEKELPCGIRSFRQRDHYAAIACRKGKRVCTDSTAAKLNVPFALPFPTLQGMLNSRLEQVIETLAKGDTSLAEHFFKKPGGRRYLENLTLILIGTLPHDRDEKEEMYAGFVEVLNRMQQRIRRRDEGDAILATALGED